MSTLRVVFVHGIMPNVISWDFSERLSRMLLGKLISYGVIAENATPEEVAQIITFERVNYSMIGDDAETRLMQSYEQESSKLYGFVNRLNKAAGLDKIRRQIITSVSDVLVYKSDYWRDEIRQLVLDKIEPYIGTGDSVSLIAHSLGSVISFDTIYDNVRHNPRWKSSHFKPTNFFTMGSPIALFTLELDRKIGSHNPQHPEEEAIPHTDMVEEDGVWYNFLDAQDVIAYPLEVLFSDKFALRDIVVQTGTNPRKAHDGYWDNDEVSDFIAGRLKLDYQRINTTLDAAAAIPTDNNADATIDSTLLPELPRI